MRKIITFADQIVLLQYIVQLEEINNISINDISNWLDTTVINSISFPGSIIANDIFQHFNLNDDVLKKPEKYLNADIGDEILIISIRDDLRNSIMTQHQALMITAESVEFYLSKVKCKFTTF